MVGKENLVEIHVRLLDEGTETSRPVKAVVLGNELYQILPTPDYDPEDEKWEFLPGSVVKVKKSDVYERNCLLAVEKLK